MSMLKKLSFLFPVGGLKETAKRFPLSAACVAVLFAVVFAVIHDLIDDDEEFFGRIAVLSVCGYFWFGAAKLLAESKGWDHAKYLAAGIPVFAGMGAIIFMSPQWGLHLIYIIPALLLAVVVAGYVIKNNDDLSFWFFNRMTWFGVAMAYIAGIVMAGGLSLALLSVHYLFDLKFDEKIYGDIWSFSCILLGPLYALSWVPKKFSFVKEECNDPPGLAFMVNWIAAPLVAIYMLILYAYFVKILVVGELPKGHLSYMVSGFGAAGVLTYLFSWPLRETGTPLLRFVHRFFFPALLIPVAMQFLAIGVRIGEYGITEQRYLVALSAVWFAIVAVAFTIKKPPIKFIPATLAVLMALASFGPWGGVSVSGNSQFHRLEKLLTQYEILQGGKIVKTQKEIPFADRQNISSIIDYLNQTKRDEWLRPWLEKPGETWMFPGSYKITEEMGFEYVGPYFQLPQENQFSYNNYGGRNGGNPGIDVRGFDYVLDSQYVYLRPENGASKWEMKWPAQDDIRMPEIEASVEGQVLIVKVGGAMPLRFDVGGYVAKEMETGKLHEKTELQMEAQSGGLRGRIVFYSINGEMKEGKPEVTNMSFRLLIGVDP
ncbi:MAG TPA: hypothetical protein DEA55_06525 [Rhodospirillaceae bacterium]|nr:hypothetical protein [Rhodospirillaceae bacterium]